MEAEVKNEEEIDIDISGVFKGRLLLLNDSNSFEYVIQILMAVLNISGMAAYGLALRVHINGKELIKEGDDIHELKRLHYLFSEANLTTILE